MQVRYRETDTPSRVFALDRQICSWLLMDSSVNILKENAANCLASSLHSQVFWSGDQHKGEIAVMLGRCSVYFTNLESSLRSISSPILTSPLL